MEYSGLPLWTKKQQKRKTKEGYLCWRYWIRSRFWIRRKKKRGRPKKEKEVVTANVGEDLIASLIQESQEEKAEETNAVSVSVTEVKDEELKPSEIEDDDEETSVVKFEIDGTTYLKSEDNVLFDMNSHDCVGIWNEESKTIDEIPDEDDEDNED